MGKLSRDKGARGEREVANLLKSVFPLARRRSSGEESQVERGRDLSGVPGFCAQVCRAARPPIERKVDEAVGASHGDELSVAFTRSDGGAWLATMTLIDWLVMADIYRRRLRVRLPKSSGLDPLSEGEEG